MKLTYFTWRMKRNQGAKHEQHYWQCTYIVTLTSVRATIVVVEKQ